MLKTDLPGSSVWHAIGRQLQNPRGVLGRAVGLMMRIANTRPNRLAVCALLIEPADIVLELGFGPGHALHLLAQQAWAGQVYGVDHSSLMIEQASRRNRALIRDGRLILYQAKFTRLPFGDSTIDKIIAVNVIYFWQDVPAVLKEICRVLRPGGRACIYATDKATMRSWKFASTDTHHLFDAAELSAAILQHAVPALSGVQARNVHIVGQIYGILVTFTVPDLAT